MKTVDSTREKLGKEKKDRPHVWLIWSVSQAGLTNLRAICTTQYLANQYRKYVSGDKKAVRVWIERTLANHLFLAGEIEANYASVGTWDHIKKEKNETPTVSRM